MIKMGLSSTSSTTMQKELLANSCISDEEQLQMDGMQEFLQFSKEMLSQKPNRYLLKVYLMGSVFAVLGTVIGLVEKVSHPFSSGEPMDAEMVMMAEQQRTFIPMTQSDVKVEEIKQEKEQSMTFAKVQGLRNLSNRLHASRS
ncbi:G0/G1 switch protein 2 [Stigmatopora argus]